MGHPYLAGVWAKLDRADQKFKQVKEKLTAGLGPGHDSIDRHEYKSGRVSWVWLKGSPSYWVDTSLDIGEICHHLRSSLDHIAWAFAQIGAERHGRTVPYHGTAFPLLGYQHRWKEVANDRLQDVPQIGKALIERFQPYQKRNHSFNRRLDLVQRLNNTDKHALINVTLTLPSYANKNYLDPNTDKLLKTESINVKNAKPGSTLHTIDTIPADTIVEVNFAFKHFIEEARHNIRIELRAEFPRLIRAVRFVACKAEATIAQM